MCSRVFLVLIGAAYICHQARAEGDVYIAELLIKSNVSLEVLTILSVLDSLTDLQVNNADGDSHTVTLSNPELVADTYSCSCADGYIWTNRICQEFYCCSDHSCPGDVSTMVPMCNPKVKVNVNGSIMLSLNNWDDSKQEKLNLLMETTNGFVYLNITSQSYKLMLFLSPINDRLSILSKPQNSSDSVIEFEAEFSSKLNTSHFQIMLTALETITESTILVNTAGMVTIKAPETKVCYQSSPVVKCMIEEPTESVSWNMSTELGNFELNPGSVVKLDHSCTAEADTSCSTLILQELTGIWEGTYQCRFTTGSITHTAEAEVNVALLPDEIHMRIDPLSADCMLNPETMPVDVTVSILKSRGSYEVWWSYMDERMSNLQNKSDGEFVFYTFTVPLSCKKTTEPKTVSVTFQNLVGQKKSEHTNIPVVYMGSTFCDDDVEHGDLWPKASDGDTVVNKTCPVGRVGYKSRTCKGTTWGLVFSNCISIELAKILNTADHFLQGLGATQQAALDIFEGLKNSSLSESDSVDTTADIIASIDVLDLMARASESVVLQEDVLYDMVGAASNMLNKSWDNVNDSIIQTMSSNYLESLEGLVKNIRVNKSNGLKSQNVDLKFCSTQNCDVFGIRVDVNKSNGIMKVVAVKNLTDKLRNNFANTRPIELLISVTLDGNNNPSIVIRLDFPRDNLLETPTCVFWNTTKEDWSSSGCFAKPDDDNYTLCECNHLTSFSVLMSKIDISDDFLDIITTVGLAVSICSLVIFLIIEWLVWAAVVKTNLSYFRHTALVNIAVFLLLAECSFLASSYPEILSENWCLALTVSKHLFFLAKFSWMLCLSVMLVHQLIFVFTPLRKRVFMFLSSIIGYICPILMVGSSYIYCKYTNRPYYNPKTCWLVFERLLEGSIHAFLIPVGSITFTNLFSMFVVIVTLVRTSDGNKSEDKETAKSILKVVVFLTPVFGVTWIIGFGLLLLDKGSTLFKIANYTFTIFNSFQGLLILLTGCFAEPKVREEFFKIIRIAKTEAAANTFKALPEACERTHLIL
ncbi:adhesion G-protein coupled receptor F3 [Antennarius striatus]|uniref:adhesion G-protein coupled receptor F3 n=1 Tax=Antennarius striatus TaxID=241820 RepID=UPI0035B12F5D